MARPAPSACLPRPVAFRPSSAATTTTTCGDRAPARGQVLILVGYSESFAQNDASASYTNVALAATVDCPYCASYERNLRIYVLSGVKDPSFDLRKSWPSLKHFD